MDKKIIVKAAAGLGNQMFQYAAAKSLSLNNNSMLYADDKMHYWNDFVSYKQKYRFDLLNVDIDKVSNISRLELFYDTLLNKKNMQKNSHKYFKY